MSSVCLLCDYKLGADAQLLEPMHIFVCEWCEPEAKTLSPEVVRTLLALDGIRPSFAVWDHGRREDSREEKLETPQPQPAEILPSAVPGLFVGDLDDVANVAHLQELGIGFVLNLCPKKLGGHYSDLPRQLGAAGIAHLAWPAEDHYNYDIVAEVVERGALDFIEAGLRSGRVLVNCWGGVNRSASVAVAYAVLRRRVALVEAVASTMARRGTVLTNRAFRLQLVRVAIEKGCPLG